MLRFILAVVLCGLLVSLSTILHIISFAYLVGVASGLLLGMVLWLKVGRRKPQKESSS